MARSTQVRKLKKTASSGRAGNSNRSTPKRSARRRGAAAKRKAQGKAKTGLRKQVFIASHRHFHDVEFQMVYVLKGWIKGEYDGEIVTMREGSCWLQPPKIKHTVLGYSDDCELLEVILPADFETVELE